MSLCMFDDTTIEERQAELGRLGERLRRDFNVVRRFAGLPEVPPPSRPRYKFRAFVPLPWLHEARIPGSTQSCDPRFSSGATLRLYSRRGVFYVDSVG